MKFLGIIPARFGSMRFPGKPLHHIAGVPMVQRVFDQVSRSTFINGIIVATDHVEIFQYCQKHGIKVEMTEEYHRNGNERCAEVALRYPEYDCIVNIHCDFPFISHDQIDQICKTLIDNPQSEIVTMAKYIKSYDELINPENIKMVFGNNMEAIYFSRHPIPYFFDAEPHEWLLRHQYYKHINLTGFRSSALVEVAALNESYLETAEEIEVLRWIENDYNIKIALTDMDTIEINSLEDISRMYLN